MLGAKKMRMHNGSSLVLDHDKLGYSLLLM
jgi:hypothetical protein